MFKSDSFSFISRCKVTQKIRNNKKTSFFLNYFVKFENLLSFCNEKTNIKES
jgi:hypothetical protein